jgi:hypothetical protein
MPPAGGLIQLVGYRYLESFDNCMREEKQCFRRKYKHFEISQISWNNEKGDVSFTKKSIMNFVKNMII